MPEQKVGSMKKIATLSIAMMLVISASACSSSDNDHREYIVKGQTATVKVTCS